MTGSTRTRAQSLGVSRRKGTTQSSGNLIRRMKTPASAQTSNNPNRIDLEAARTFLRLLDPKAKRFHFRVVPEAEGATGHARNIVGRFDDVADELIAANEAGCAVYTSTQAMKGTSASLANLKRLRCCWIDVDARQGQKLPKTWGLLPPQLVVESSPGSYHAWWLLSDEPSREDWSGVQQSLVQRFKSDPNGVTNVAKLLRVPGFLHRKGEPHRVSIIHSSPVRYGFREMLEVYTPVAPKRIKPSSSKTKAGSSVDVAVLRSALDFLEDVPHPRVKSSTTYSDDYDTWFRFGLAIYRALGDRGFEHWDEWSSTSRVYPGRIASRAKWTTFAHADHEDGVTVGSVFFIAKRHGWSHAREVSRVQLARALEKYRGSLKQVHA